MLTRYAPEDNGPRRDARDDAKPTTLVALLRRRALHEPDRLAFAFQVDDDTATSLTYAELDARARAIAAAVQALGVEPGDRALLLYPPGLEYIAAFFGCLYAGLVAVPAYPPRLNQSLGRVQAIAADARAVVALTTTVIRTKLADQVAETTRLQSLSWLATDEIAAGDAAWFAPSVSADTLAFLQYTSGSTGVPKGVMLTHGNLLHNTAVQARGLDLGPATRGVSWLPLYHDMGLIGGVFQPIYSGFPGHLMSPIAFLQRPARWLRAIARHRATVSGGPDFAYALCARKIGAEERATLDLSSWEIAFTGAEPVRKETLDAFATTFASCGFRREAFTAAYGLAEATLYVSSTPRTAVPIVTAVSRAALATHRVAAPDAGDDDQHLVSCGRPPAEQPVAIVHPETRLPCAGDEVGEIWVKGPSVAQGYWNRPEETRHTFRAYLADSWDGPFLRTGDLGFLHDGELFITGRLKDLIIIRGRNHYPQDVERTVEECYPALRPTCGAAFSVDEAGDERLVIVQEVERGQRDADLDAAVAAIRQAVANQHGLEVYAIALLRTGSVSKTSSGKIQRHACRARYLADGLDTAFEWRLAVAPPPTAIPGVASDLTDAASVPAADEPPTAEAIVARLVAQLADALQVSPDDLDTSRPFASYGLDSMKAVSLAADLAAWLGRELPPTLIWDYPTVDALAEHLAAQPVAAYPSVPRPAEQWRSAA